MNISTSIFLEKMVDLLSATSLLLMSRYLLEISTVRKDVQFVKGLWIELTDTWKFHTVIALRHRRRARKLLRYLYHE